MKNPFDHVSAAPTLPKAGSGPRLFDLASLYEGPFGEQKPAADAVRLDEKLRQAYFWIVNHAIFSPHYDIEYCDGPPAEFAVGGRGNRLRLPSDQSYSSFILLPLLTLATRRKCLFVGGPGRGKTASAVLMGVLAGYPVREVRRAMQHGHPQMTIADLLGQPLPKDLVQAEDIKQIRIAWRSWISMRVKIVDEYNRIPTRTQSALLTLMGDGYAELYDQIVTSPPSAWFLTANDDAGGGTYQVIEALKDRIDVIVQALPFNPRFLKALLLRIEENLKPEELVPRALIFSEAEQDRLESEIRAVLVPEPLRRRLEFFVSQFEFCEPAAAVFEYMGKDTARLAGVEWSWLTAQDDGRDRLQDIGCQTRNGLSVRNLMTLLVYAKALAYFRNRAEVELDDLRQILPFVLADKLKPDLDAPFFDVPENSGFRCDRVGWLRRLFDASCAEYDRLGLDRVDEVGAIQAELDRGLDGIGLAEVRSRLTRIELAIGKLLAAGKLYGPLHDDLLLLKAAHQRYTNYGRWLKSAGAAT